MIENLSLCLYLGNTATINEQSLLDYCSKYGQIRLDSSSEREFRDFHLIEFQNLEQCQAFLRTSPHQIGSIVLEVKPYLDLFNHQPRFNLDRKLFLGPIEQPKNLNTIIQFYKLIDRNLLASFLETQYLLLEFSNEKYRQVIFERKAIPKTLDNQIYEIHLPIYPQVTLDESCQCESELVQIKLEYERKFFEDRSFLDRAFDHLITEQRMKLIKLEDLIKRL